ncbi:pentapeptide repeat-containing protein [Dendronalium phyllosphericum]
MPQDFSHQNLRGRSFKNQNLAGANFSNADIRGADFSGANLTDANFNHAQAGVEDHWRVFITLISWLLSGLSGFIWYFNGYLLLLIFEGSLLKNYLIGGVTSLLLIIFFYLTIRQGVGAGLAVFAIAVAASTFIVVFAGDTFAAGSVAGVVAGAGAGVFTAAVAVASAGRFMFTIAFITAFTIAALKAGANAFVMVIATAGLFFSIYIGWQITKENEKYSLIRNVFINIAAIGGTSFCRANLTNANFTQAIVKSTDLRNALLTYTNWYQAKQLETVRAGKTYLQKKHIRQLLVTAQGQGKNFDSENLRGVNLQAANLSDASFIGADLSQANLQNADLSRVKLKQTQLDATDFTGATLTGAYIQDWGITTDTKFDNVRCEYIYMRLPTKDNPDPHRKPDNRQEVFADGEFGDFIKPIFDTLDLYHSQGVDPRAIAISFKQLAQNHPDAELEIVAIEKRSENNFLLRAKTVPTADKSRLSAEYFELYNNLKALPKEDLIFLLAQRDGQIQSLEVAFKTVNQGLIKVAETPKKVSKFDLKGAQFGGGLVNADTVNADQIGGNINNYNPEQKQNLAQAAAEIQQLLNQLSQS